MKRSNVYVSGLLLAGSTFLFSCEKNDLVVNDEEIASAKKSGKCEMIAFRNSTISPSPYTFQKQVDPATGRLKTITAGVFQGGAIMNAVTFNVHWTNNSVAFVRSSSSTDTVLIVALNAQKRPVSVIAGNKPDPNYLPTSFEYNDRKLSAMKISLAGKQITSRFLYDNRNNLIRINDDQQASEIPGRVEFTYGNRKINQQAYFDEPRPFSWNTYSLLQFSGFFPELQPARVRTGVKVFWGNNYKAYDVQLINHQISDGRLTRYDVSYSSSSQGIIQHIDWACNLRNGEDDDDDDDDDNDD